jgi:hypothetical protein
MAQHSAARQFGPQADGDRRKVPPGDAQQADTFIAAAKPPKP